MRHTLEHVPCPYCGSAAYTTWAEENGNVAVQCDACRFVYVNPRPPRDTIDEAAQTGLHETERGALDVVGKLGFRRAKVRMFRQRLPALFPEDVLRTRPVRWLDVGAGFGELVAAVRSLAHEAAQIEGIEPCRPKVEVARRHGLAVSSRSLQELPAPYDAVSLINVFSHLPDPAGFLTDLKRHLVPGGDLVLVTGNGADMARSAYPDPLYLPDHLVFAGQTHVRGLLERLGFEVVCIQAYPQFLPEARPLVLLKNLVKKAQGRPTARVRPEGPFRSLFVRARRVS